MVDFIAANEDVTGEGRASINASLTLCLSNTLFSLQDDWVAPAPNPNGAWSYGYMIEANAGNQLLPSFQSFQLSASPYDPGIWDAWEAPDTYDSCWVGKMIAQPWSFPVGQWFLMLGTLMPRCALDR